MGESGNDSDQEHIHVVPSRRDALIAGASLLAVPLLGRVTSIVHAAEGTKRMPQVGSPAHSQAEKVKGTTAEWSSYGGDKASSKYSPLAQINGGNFSRLTTAWTWKSAEEQVAKANDLKTWVWESTPLMVGGVLCQHFAFPSRCPRCRDRQGPLGL